MAVPDDEWGRPRLIGEPHAAEQAQFIAAPLLAGAAVALIGVLAADGARFRWPGPAILCFTAAAICLIGSIQLAFRARRHLYSPAELYDWWKGQTPPEQEVLVEEQQRNFELWLRWTNRAGTAYNLGVTALGVGAVGLLAPPEAASQDHAIMRWLATAAVAASAGWELALTVQPWTSRAAEWLRREDP
ncbi:cell division protein FtsW (lipid II flippase) [Streptomyces umbrinus]|uniref:Cell division protein FtsW (Lipid II flippase) n=1 Tax=Streptomyces umbrinus TaxID=67370 RepID=A0ABU0SGB4_9ACTN|nr:hypothetical protein [Streptomyces umbrinus]MDQ1022615.1 cell division protein FtsW (lipid II flippase) [Streptomyces umbrinus]